MRIGKIRKARKNADVLKDVLKTAEAARQVGAPALPEITKATKGWERKR